MTIKRVLICILAALVFLLLLLPNFLSLNLELYGLSDIDGMDSAQLSTVMRGLNGALFVFFLEVLIFALVGRYFLWLLVNLPFYLWLPVECFYLLSYGEATSAHILAIVSETNLEEVLGYVGGWLVVIYYCLYVLFFLLLLYFFFRAKIGWSHRSRWWVIGSFSPVLVLFWLSHVEGDRPILEDNRDVFVERGVGFGFDQFKSSYPLGFGARLVEYFEQLSVLEHYARVVSQQTSGLARSSTDGEEVYVVMLGESSRPDHWGLAGYERNTTPLLSSRDDVYFYENMVSASSATRTAVPVLLSRTTASDLRGSYLKNSWIADFKSAGFKVYWLSTQMPVGSHDTMIGVYASLADEVRYLNDGTYRGMGRFDEVLVEELASVLGDHSDKKKLVLLHSLGSHTPYQFRYPDNFIHFEPSPTTEEVVSVFDSGNEDLLVNAYDNSILYTDYVISSILELLDSNSGGVSSFFWYISDHGQTLFDEDCDKGGHGFFSEYNFRVPALFWASERYFSTRPELRGYADKRRGLPMKSADFFDTMLEMGGFVSLDGFNGYFSDDYQAGRRLVTVSGAREVNFDDELQGNACEFSG